MNNIEAIFTLQFIAREEHKIKVEAKEEAIKKAISSLDRFRWRTTEKLPNVNCFTLIKTKENHVGISYFQYGWWGGYEKDGIKAWMPLPDGSEE